MEENQSNNEVESTKKRAKRKLLFMLIFFLSVIVFINIGSMLSNKKTPKSEEQKPIVENSISLENIIDELYDNNYKYIYELKIDDYIVKYEGEVSDYIDTGYKEDSTGIIKYVIENDIIYEVKIDSKIELLTLYDNINTNYINLDYIYNLIKNNINTSDIYNYEIIDNESYLKISFTINNDMIEKVEVLVNETDSYKLLFEQLETKEE